MLKETKAKDTPWNYGQRVKNFVEYLMPKHLPPTTLDGFTLPKHKNAGRKNWIRKEKILKILEAADNDRD
jgi:hypothetical protein